MTVPTDAVVDAHLARLDAEARRAFVADLWAARGFETSVDDAVVVARRHAESLVVYPLPPRRLRRPPRPEPPVDVVVAFEAVPRWVEASDVRVLTPADLRGMLRYALDPADAASISRRHLGSPPAALAPPLSLRVRDGVEALHGVGESVGVTTVVTLLAVVVLVFAASGALFVDDGTEPLLGSESVAPPGGADATTPEQTPTASPTPTDESDAAAVGSLDTVPGVGPDGVTNLTALALAHDRELGENYTLWTDRYRPQNGVPGAPRTQRDTDITVEGDRYLVEETFETGEERRLARVVYFDGTDWYVDERTAETASVRWVDGRTGNVAPDPHRLRRALVTRYLATPTTDVTERLYVGDETRYRLEGEGRPPGFPDRVYNYSFVAVVGDRGLVHGAAVEFTVVTVEGSYRLRFEWTYGALGATSVTEPAWLHLALPRNDSAGAESTEMSGNRTTEVPRNTTETAS
ncbi:hypothetical protein C2R22_01080 [Salinigranum rubrum]|uniref:Uncharacterized protein n=1 Tax=Salinigranum rubrum TaxID=755307 RepID=A0A2I8VES7_9EURY|nr:hypothetical protein [Salinigranum rubrum]AUV80422.1 hypothetical protein C2R22_01080 [Salinigranum rubrum]